MKMQYHKPTTYIVATSVQDKLLDGSQTLGVNWDDGEVDASQANAPWRDNLWDGEGV